jgi:hypothetical protein
MPKMYNILKDKDAFRRILETLGDLCRTHEGCLYCPFHEGCHCLIVVNGRTPMEYFEEDDDE